MELPQKRYIGDGLYASHDGYQSGLRPAMANRSQTAWRSTRTR